MEKVFTALGILLVLIAILYLSYVCTRYVGQKAGAGGFGGSSRNIHILEQKMLSRDGSVAIVQISGKLYLVGVTPQNISLLTEIEDESLIKEFPPAEEEKFAVPFKDVMLRFKDRK